MIKVNLDNQKKQSCLEVHHRILIILDTKYSDVMTNRNKDGI